MRRVLALLFLVGAVSVGAQTNDVSFWHRGAPGESLYFPWYVYNDSGEVLDVRYNFDADKTFGLCAGWSLGGGHLAVIPEACGYYGDLHGYGPEALVIGSWGRLSLFSQNQYVWDLRDESSSRPNRSFAYHWVDLLYRVHRNVQVGVDEQVMVETRRDDGARRMDVGPALKVTVRGYYARTWVAWSVGPQDVGRRTLFLGVGRSW